MAAAAAIATNFHPWLTTASVLYPIFSPLRILHATIRSSLSLLLNALIFLGILYAVLHRLGVLKRLVCKFAEWQLSRNCNGALFTVGDIDLDLRRGHAIIHDLVAHSPKRSEWHWDSPVLARAGKITVTFNVLSTIDKVGPWLGFPAKDVHTVLVEDVVAFIEKRRNVFNFHLLDESLDIPDPTEVLESMRRVTDGGNGGASGSAGGAGPAGGLGASTATIGGGAAKSSEGGADEFSGSATATTTDETAGAAGDARKTKDARSADAEEEGAEKANEIVTHVLGAVSTIGRAANEGGKEGLQSALARQKDGFVSQLRQFKAQVGTGTVPASPSSSPRGGGMKRQGSIIIQRHSKSIERMAKDSVKVMKEMGKVVERSVSDMKEQVDSFQRPPRKKEGWTTKNPDERFRFGCIVVRDARIFSRDIIVGQKAGVATAGGSLGASIGGGGVAAEGGASGGGEGRSEDQLQQQLKASSSSASAAATNLTGWSKPIYIKELTASGAELCPPIRARNERTGMPEVGLHIEKVLNILLKRLAAEIAKTNSGRVLQTAFGEVFSWMDVKRSDSTRSSIVR